MSTARTVAAIADQISALPTYPSGSYNSPADDGSALLLTFVAAGGRAVLLRANPRGSPSITGGRTVQELTPPAMTHLTTLATSPG